MFPGLAQFSGLACKVVVKLVKEHHRGVVEIMAPVLIRLAAACLDPFARFLMAQSDAHVTPKRYMDCRMISQQHKLAGHSTE